MLDDCPAFATVDYVGYSGGGCAAGGHAFSARRDVLTMHSVGAAADRSYSGGSLRSCHTDYAAGPGVCTGCPVGTTLATGDTVTWGSGTDDIDAMNCGRPGSDGHASVGRDLDDGGHRYTGTVTPKWELCFVGAALPHCLESNVCAMHSYTQLLATCTEPPH